jgi:hypothetical protein
VPLTEPHVEPEIPEAEGHDSAGSWGAWDKVLVVAVAGAVLAGLVLRFVTQSPLWLDEALSVNIARLPIGDIPHALRHDGHPPLYYVLLHGWMSLFGHGDVAVRAFSGVWAVALLPLVWVAGLRLGGRRVAAYSLALVALSPYAIRYGTETRMYAMVMVLALIGWLLVDDALVRPTLPRLVAIAVVVALLLWTHYWAMWLLAAAGIALIARAVLARRRGDAEGFATSLRIIGAIVVGGLAFVPWLGTLLYQGAHTGTPWARPVRPTEMMTFTLADLGGGPQAEAIVLGWAIALLALVGITGRATTPGHVEIAPRIEPAARAFVVAVVGTLSIACVVGYATGATYASRYAAVFFPFLILLAGVGLARIGRHPFAAVLMVGLLGLGAFGGVRNVITDRSDARRSADAIDAAARPGDLVVFCPDQLGPSTTRLLEPGLDLVTFPRFEDPRFVDWVDYKERLAGVDVDAFAQRALDRAGDHRLFLVYSTSYITHEDTCPALVNALSRLRPPTELTRTSEAFEPSGVIEFAPPAR